MTSAVDISIHAVSPVSIVDQDLRRMAQDGPGHGRRLGRRSARVVPAGGPRRCRFGAARRIGATARLRAGVGWPADGAGVRCRGDRGRDRREARPPVRHVDRRRDQRGVLPAGPRHDPGRLHPGRAALHGRPVRRRHVVLGHRHRDRRWRDDRPGDRPSERALRSRRRAPDRPRGRDRHRHRRDRGRVGHPGRGRRGTAAARSGRPDRGRPSWSSRRATRCSGSPRSGRPAARSATRRPGPTRSRT